MEIRNYNNDSNELRFEYILHDNNARAIGFRFDARVVHRCYKVQPLVWAKEKQSLRERFFIVDRVVGREEMERLTLMFDKVNIWILE
jgi:hypothetical protein